jgi:LPXTG-motif cell wall-anchored protein
MKKFAVLCIAALGSALLVLGTAPSASAYPELTCSVDVNHTTVHPGDTFTARGHAGGLDENGLLVDGSDIHWTFNWNGVTKHRTGMDVSVTFTAPHVTKSRTIRLTARSTSPAGTCVRHVDVTVGAAIVSPPGGGSGGGLPNTGGPGFWILVAGLVLLLGGGGAVVAARRRA